jgi:auxin efflux carrier family
MIALGDLYKVVEAMAPLYFALGLGYGSVRWWRFFTAEHCGAINTLVVCFSMPFFTFDFVVRTDPYAMNYRVIAADAVAKLLAVLAAAAWARCARAKGGARSYSWSITGFSLASLNNTLVVGVPLLDAMYGKWAQDLIVQIAVVQSIVWFPLLLLAFELRKAWVVTAANDDDDDGGGSTTSDDDRARRVKPVSSEKDGDGEMDVEAAPTATGGTSIRVWPMARTVGLKLARNPNVYASVLGVAWACVAYRYVVQNPPPRTC